MNNCQLFLKMYNNGDNDGTIIIKCKDGELSCHKDFFIANCDYLESHKSKCESIDLNLTNQIVINVQVDDINSVTIDMTEYSSIVMNNVLNKCYSPCEDYSSTLSLNDTFDIMVVEEHLMFKQKHTHQLYKHFINNINKSNFVKALEITNAHSDITQNKDYKIDNCTLHTSIYKYVAKEFNNYINVSDFSNIQSTMNNIVNNKLISGAYLFSLIHYQNINELNNLKIRRYWT